MLGHLEAVVPVHGTESLSTLLRGSVNVTEVGVAGGDGVVVSRAASACPNVARSRRSTYRNIIAFQAHRIETGRTFAMSFSDDVGIG